MAYIQLVKIHKNGNWSVLKSIKVSQDYINFSNIDNCPQESNNIFYRVKDLVERDKYYLQKNYHSINFLYQMKRLKETIHVYLIMRKWDKEGFFNVLEF